MTSRICKIAGRLGVVAILALVTNVASYGQNLESGRAEVTGHLGVVGGIGGSHVSLGGSIGTPINDRLILSADFSFIPLGSSSVTVGGASARSSASAFNFNANMQYQFKPTHDVVPYAGLGVGFLRSSFETSNNIPGSGGFNVSGSTTNAYVNLGGGLRYYVDRRWGVRPELMFFAGENTYVRFAGGIFYQF